MKIDSLCVVFVTNISYFDKFVQTCQELITVGKYDGPICLIIGDDLLNNQCLQIDFIVKNKIIIKYFPNMIFSNDFKNHMITSACDDRGINKQFQWHKLNVFDTFFKKWDYIFFLDCGMKIFSDISPILKELPENTFFAHSDAYPNYNWKLHDQFDKTKLEYYDKLKNKYNLNTDYPQTTIMFYDTKIIKNDTFQNLLNLASEYPISRTNEQAIVALYFTNIEPLWKQITVGNIADICINHSFYYDYMSRNKNNKYIMLKLIQ